MGDSAFKEQTNTKRCPICGMQLSTGKIAVAHVVKHGEDFMGSKHRLEATRVKLREAQAQLERTQNEKQRLKERLKEASTPSKEWCCWSCGVTVNGGHEGHLKHLFGHLQEADGGDPEQEAALVEQVRDLQAQVANYETEVKQARRAIREEQGNSAVLAKRVNDLEMAGRTMDEAFREQKKTLNNAQQQVKKLADEAAETDATIDELMEMANGLAEKVAAVAERGDTIDLGGPGTKLATVDGEGNAAWVDLLPGDRSVTLHLHPQAVIGVVYLLAKSGLVNATAQVPVEAPVKARKMTRGEALALAHESRRRQIAARTADFRDRIKPRLREDAVDEVAKSTGASFFTVINWLQGQVPGQKFYLALCKHFGLEPADGAH